MPEQLVVSLPGVIELIELATPGPPGPAGPPGPGGVAAGVMSALSYDASGRLVAYTRNNVPHFIAYPNANTLVVSNTTGAPSVTVTFDRPTTDPAARVLSMI